MPCVADRSVASIPKGLPIEHVNRALASCNRKSAIGRGDYAILLLLARLGLRAGEVVCLTLEDKAPVPRRPKIARPVSLSDIANVFRRMVVDYDYFASILSESRAFRDYRPRS